MACGRYAGAGQGRRVPRFYTVDRLQTLTAGQTIDLVRYTDVQPSLLQAHLIALFPNGVSKHGEQYMVRGSTAAVVINPIIELIFEYVRRSSSARTPCMLDVFVVHLRRFEHRSARLRSFLASRRRPPSRFQAFFAWGSVEDARTFRGDIGSAAPIWEVAADSAFRADMRLLTLQDSLLVASYRAHLYWLGATIEPVPVWEYLLTPPVRVLRRVE